MESPDIIYYMRFAASLVFVLCLMGVISFVLKKFNIGNIAQQAGNKKRLSVSEIMPLDSRRRAVLVRRDDVEHLVILGVNGETLLETGIKPPQKQQEDKECE